MMPEWYQWASKPFVTVAIGGGTLEGCCSVCFSLAAATSPNLQASLVAVFVVG